MLNKDLLINGEVFSSLDYVEDSSIAVVITSPPYWQQRNYNFDMQIGVEKSPEEYIGRLLKIFGKLFKKLRNDGVFFLNIGDKYLNRYGNSNLLMIPYRLAYHMINDGWNLCDILIWYKPNHMPSSVENRFTNTYEPILVFSKSTSNLYSKEGSIIEVPLQQTPWKHTAVYPERLVKELLNRVNLKDDDIILDPFAGTGTTGVVVNDLRKINGKKLYTFMIEGAQEFVEIIKKRTGINNVLKASYYHYSWSAVIENTIPEVIKPLPLLKDKNGEVFIANKDEEFLSILKGLNEEEFKNFHREDAIYFLGIKNWSIESLYYSHNVPGYVLRNMLIISNKFQWFPVFMFAKDTTKTSYKFFIDRVRIGSQYKWKTKLKKQDFLGMKVKDISSKKPLEGYILQIQEFYEDGFPKVVKVNWGLYFTYEFVMHPVFDEFLMEGVKFLCPKCGEELQDYYDPLSRNICNKCGAELWTSLETVPKVKEPELITKHLKNITRSNMIYEEESNCNENNVKKTKLHINSKFLALDRVNWGASPGARKTILGEYFTKMRIYRISQPMIAQYLNLLRKSKKVSINNIINTFPKEYKHTIGHWFRKDFGGSIPLPEDVRLLKNFFGVDNGILDLLERTALKFQTVRTSVKGKNPGDYLTFNNDMELIEFLKKLYIPPSEYLELIKRKKTDNTLC